MSTTYRTFVRDLSTEESLAIISREVKNQSNKKNSPYLLKKVLQFNPEIKNISSSQAFANAVANAIEAGISYKNLLDSFGKLQLICEASRSYAKFGSSLESLYKIIRKPIREKYGLDSTQYRTSIRLMKFSPEIWSARQIAYTTMVSQRNRDRINFESTKIYEIMDEILTNDPSWSSLVILAQLSIGGRSDEIISFSNFSAVEGQPNMIRQDNISKQSGKREGQKRTFVIKPVFHLNVYTFLAVMKSIREQLANDIIKFKGRHYELSNSKNGSINRKIKKYFSYRDDVKKITSHTMRGIYASCAYQVFANKQTHSENAYLSDVLGHQEGQIAVASSYSHIIVNFSDSTPAVDEMNSRTDTQHDIIEDLRLKVEALEISINSKKCIAVTTEIKIDNRNSCIKDGRVYQRLMGAIEELNDKGILITRKRLVELNFGSAVISRYFKECKIDKEDVEYERCRKQKVKD
jgi:hypothetical protein